MTDHLLREFKRHNVHLSMSLPGLETFEKHTGVDNASGVLHWFGEAKKLGVSTTVNVTVTALNYHELFETLANGVLAGADSVLINRFLAGGRGLSHLKELSLNKEQLNGMLDPAGFIRACNHSPRKVGHIFDEEIVTDVEYWNMFSYRGYIPRSCILCKDVNYCDCGCRETASIINGNPKELDPCLSSMRG